MAVYGGPDIITDGLVLNIDAANIKSFDPVNTNVELLLHMDGANNSTTFTDSSKNGTTVTSYGNAKISTDQSKFGGSSAYFDGDGDYLRADGNTNFGTGDFTIDCWVMLTSDAKSFGIDTRNVPTSSAGINVGMGVNGLGGYVYGIGGLTLYSTSIQLNTWYHVAYCRKSGVLTGYLNGVAGTPVTVTNNFTNNYGTIATNINNRLNSSVQTQAWFNGFLDELRIVKGKALYTSNFTPERKPYLDGNKIYDLSGNENNGTLVNGPTYSSDNYGIMSFDGTDDKIEIPSNSIFNFSSNFAINFAFKLNSINNNYTQIGPNINTSGGFSFYYVGPGNYYNIGVNSFVISNRISNFLVRGFAVETNKWYFITITRNGTSLQMYINGEQLGSTVSNSTNFTQGVLQLGGDSDSSTHAMNGYISNLCIYKNTTFEIQYVKQNYNALKGRYGL